MALVSRAIAEPGGDRRAKLVKANHQITRLAQGCQLRVQQKMGSAQRLHQEHQHVADREKRDFKDRKLAGLIMTHSAYQYATRPIAPQSIVYTVLAAKAYYVSRPMRTLPAVPMKTAGVAMFTSPAGCHGDEHTV